MDDIARYLAVSKKTIYQFYKDKDEIVRLFTQRHLEKDEQRFCSITEDAKNPMDEMVRFFQHIRIALSSINPCLFFDLKKYYPAIWQTFADHKRNVIIRNISSNLQRGIDAGFYRSDINVAVLARLRVEQVQMAFDQALFKPDEFELMEVQEQFLDHFIRGIVTPEGLQLYLEYKPQLPK
jgi:AcrR family transcriptional regulator